MVTWIVSISSTRRNGKFVIARSEATKQSILSWPMDCFAEPVIGRAFARPLARNDDFMFGRLSPLDVDEARRALVDIGADRLKLIGPTHQFHLLDRFS